MPHQKGKLFQIDLKYSPNYTPPPSPQPNPPIIVDWEVSWPDNGYSRLGADIPLGPPLPVEAHIHIGHVPLVPLLYELLGLG